MSRMREPRISKVTLNIGVGEAGERLAKAETVLKQVTDSSLKPVRTEARSTIPGLGVRKREQIGCKLTLRGGKAVSFLKNALNALDNTLNESNIDSLGNFSFGIKEHIDMQGIKYDPNIGIFGMDVSIAMERPGYRVSRRARQKSHISKKHLLTKNDTIEYLKKEFGVNFSGEA